MQFEQSILDMIDNIHYQNEQGDFTVETHFLRYDLKQDTMGTDRPLQGRLRDYEFQAIGLDYRQAEESLVLVSNVIFADPNDEFTLMSPGFLDIDLKDGNFQGRKIIYRDKLSNSVKANRFFGAFDKKNNKNQLKQLHFLEKFSYHSAYNKMHADKAVIHFVQGEADRMITTGNVRIDSKGRIITGESAYLDYKKNVLEICDSVHIIFTGGRRVTTPCAIVSLNRPIQHYIETNKALSALIRA